jgi:ubiquinone/menaquinone biosynthesis C-methylase UbiE
MSHPSPTEAPNLFDQWAQVYDLQENPLLALESRWLPSFLPDLQTAHVLDVGCGTGRWLKHLETFTPASLTGCDPSSAMLTKARPRLQSSTHLHHASASALPTQDSSVDLLLASFVLSYMDDLSLFTAECARTIRPGGRIILSDMHPSTAHRLGWKRSFHLNGERVDVPSYSRTLNEIVSTFAADGFILMELESPAFAEPERYIFERANKLDDYIRLLDTPAIYILKFQRPTHPSSAAHKPNTLQLQGAPWAIDDSNWANTPVVIQDGLVTTPNLIAQSLDLTGYLLLPGLINAHDHLEFALFPNLGRTPQQPPYRNCAEWATEIHQTHQSTIDLHRQVPLKTRLWFGAIRNLLCGATTVCHHNPLYAELNNPDFPIHVVEDFSWAHSLAFDTALTQRFASSPADQPFILHAGEGIDEASRQEFQQLNQRHLLTPRTVLVHALACNQQDIALLNQTGTSLILCPTSNQFLFHTTLAPATINSLHRVALGSDSPITAAGDLLDEIYTLHTTKPLTPSRLYDIVTTAPASILHLKKGEGTLHPASRADIIAVKHEPHQSPSELLSNLTLTDIELVLLSGHVHLASPELYQRLPHHMIHGLHFMEILVSGQWIKRWIKAPLPQLFPSAEQVLGPGNLRLGNKEVRHLPTP